MFEDDKLLALFYEDANTNTTNDCEANEFHSASHFRLPSWEPLERFEKLKNGFHMNETSDRWKSEKRSANCFNSRHKRQCFIALVTDINKNVHQDIFPEALMIDSRVTWHLQLLQTISPVKSIRRSVYS